MALNKAGALKHLLKHFQILMLRHNPDLQEMVVFKGTISSQHVHSAPDHCWTNEPLV